MKKNVIMSSVAAFAVVGIFALSGCGGNSGSKHESSNVFKTDKVSFEDSEKKSSSIGADGSSKKMTVAIKIHDGDEVYNKNPMNFSVRSEDENCKQAALTPDTSDDCKIEAQETCEYETVNGTEGNSMQAFHVLSEAGESVKDGKYEYRYGGTLKLFTDDDIDDCTLYIDVQFMCTMGSNGLGVYVNGDTVEPNKDVLVVVADKHGKTVKAHGKLKFKDNPNGEVPIAYVEFSGENGINISELDIKNLKGAYFYVKMKSKVDANDAFTGATGASGAGA